MKIHTNPDNQECIITIDGQEILKINGDWFNIIKKAVETPKTITIPEAYEYARKERRILPQKTLDNWMRTAAKRWGEEYQDFDLSTRETRRAPYDEFVLWYRQWRIKSRNEPATWIDGQIGEVLLPEWMRLPTEE